MAMETALCMLECMEPVNPLDIVRVMRNQRGMLIQTPVRNSAFKYIFVYALLFVYSRPNTSLSVKAF